MNHSTETFQRMEAIFHEALALPNRARATLIAARCDGDTALMAEVHSLLEASEMEEQLTASHRNEPRSDNASSERMKVGPYQIDRLLGRGGMGAVYLAHRTDGQFEQQVAIKLIDLPLATDFFRERFRQERQILAGLQHPFIARLLDGGVTADGELYLAMEYVDGVPIHRFCENNHLSITARLTLFLKVCEAVQFAHQNLVVHRDLKPDNILVAQDGSPRLLDFGTAKLVSPSLDKQEGDLTRQGFQSFTPQYASPEQVLGSPITTASDTYSLGVLLYLLLTGTMPYELKEVTIAEMVRVICKEPPRKPTHAAGSKARLDPDLEAILAKALRKESAERYRTAEQFASDVQDYLEGRPVAARRGTLRYRATKFIRRNRLALAGATLLVASLLAGLLGVLWQAKIANAERRKAEARSADLRQLSNSLLSELDEAIKQIPGSTGAQKLLVTRVLEHLDHMASDAHGDRRTQLDLIDAYTRLGNIQGNAYDQNLGDTTGALASLGKAVSLAQPLIASNPSDPDALRALATAQEDRGEVLSGTDNIPETVASMQAAVQSYDLLIALPEATPAQFFEASTANGTLGDEVGQDTGLADIAAAIAAYRKAIDLDNRAVQLDPNFLSARRGLAGMQMHLGNAELDADPAQALKDFRIALQQFDALPEGSRTSLSTLRTRTITLRKQAIALAELGQYSQAEPLFEEALKTFQHLADLDTKDLRSIGDLKRALLDQAASYEYAANPALASPDVNPHQSLLSASQTLERTRAVIEQILKINPNDEDRQSELANVQARIGTIHAMLRTSADAESLSRTGLSALRNFAAKDNSSPMILDLATTAILRVEPASLRDPKLAVRWAERGVALTHRKAPAWMLSLAQAYRSSGQLENARATAKEGLVLLPAPQPGTPRSRIRKLLELEAHAS